MALRNSQDDLGLISRLIYWIMALLIVTMTPLGLGLTLIEPTEGNLWLFSLHKTLGMAVLLLLPLLLLWHLLSPPPPLPTQQGLHRLLIKAWRWLMIVLIIAVPISGWAGTSASSTAPLFLGPIPIPALVGPSDRAAFVWFILHEIFAKTLFGMVILHGVIVLKQMLARSSRSSA